MLLNPYRFVTISGDPHWANVVALLNGVTSEGIVDAKGRAITRSGTNALITSDSDFTSGCIGFDGSTSNWIKYTSPTSWLEFYGDFTIEIDYKPTGKVSNYPALLGGYTTYGANGGFAVFDRHASLSTKISIALNGSFPVLQSVANVVDGTKYIIQISRSGSTIRLFINGTVQGTYNYSGVVRAHNNYFAIGVSGDSGDSSIKGSVGRLRITSGVARNTTNYTPTTAPFPLA